MEFIIELLLDLILEGSIEISSNRKVPKWIRYPLIVLIILFFTIVIFGMLILGLIILKNNLYFGLLMILISIILLILGIKKYKIIYVEKKNEEKR